MKTLENIYNITNIFFWIFYIMSLIGIWAAAPKYLDYVDNIMKTLVACILIYFFNPLKKTKCTPFHKKVVFSSAFFILLSVSFNTLLQIFPFKLQ